MLLSEKYCHLLTLKQSDVDWVLVDI